MNAVERLTARFTRLLDRLIPGSPNRSTRHTGLQLPVHPDVPDRTHTQEAPPMPSGRIYLIQGCTIISRALPPRAQDVYFLYPPTSQEAAYVAELREVTFTKNAAGGFIAEGGRRRKPREIYATLHELGQTYNLDSEEWQVMR